MLKGMLINLLTEDQLNLKLRIHQHLLLTLYAINVMIVSFFRCIIQIFIVKMIMIKLILINMLIEDQLNLKLRIHQHLLLTVYVINVMIVSLVRCIIQIFIVKTIMLKGILINLLLEDQLNLKLRINSTLHKIACNEPMTGGSKWFFSQSDT